MYVCVCVYLLFVYTTTGRMQSILNSHRGVCVGVGGLSSGPSQADSKCCLGTGNNTF